MEIVEEKMPVATHPYAKRLEATLAKQKTMQWLLEKKIEHLNKLYPTLVDELGYYDAQISKVKTEGELDVLKRIIAEKENYFKQYMVQFEKDIVEVTEKYQRLVDIAKKSTKDQVKRILGTVVWERIEGDDEAKIALYKQLKKYV